jgi:hypothetical protein
MNSKPEKHDESTNYVADQLEYGRQCFQAALDYVARGWVALPVCHYQHHGCGKEHRRTCTTPGLRPLVNVASYQDRRPTRADLEAWWRSWPVAGVAIVLGRASNVIAIDVSGPGGEQKLREVSGGDLPRTAEIAIENGRRLLYRLAPGAQAHSVEMDVEDGELKLLGEGVVLVLPPSGITRDGVFRWKEEGGNGS